MGRQPAGPPPVRPGAPLRGPGGREQGSRFVPRRRLPRPASPGWHHQPAQKAHGTALQQKLVGDLASGCSQGAAEADLSRPFRDRHQCHLTIPMAPTKRAAPPNNRTSRSLCTASRTRLGSAWYATLRLSGLSGRKAMGACRAMSAVAPIRVRYVGDSRSVDTLSAGGRPGFFVHLQ